jgi:hypothetical protein
MSGNLNLNNNSLINVAGGGEATPSISFNGDPDTGIYSLGADSFQFATGGSGRVQVSNQGLLIFSSEGIRFNDADDSNTVGLYPPDDVTSNYDLILPPAGPSAGQILESDASGVLSWVTPASGGGDLINGGNSGAVVVGSNDDTLSLEASGATAITVLGNGNVGIGTTSPDGLFHFHGPNQDFVIESDHPTFGWATDFMFRRSNAGGLAPGGSIGDIQFRAHDGTNYRQVASIDGMTDGNPSAGSTPGQLVFRTTPNASTTSLDRMVIDRDGYVGIGTTSPGGKLDVNGDIRMLGSTSGYAGFQAPATAGNNIWTLPTGDGTSGQVLSTDGSGNLSWTTAGGGAGTVTLDDGSSASPSLNFTNSTGTGLYYVGGNTIGYGIAGNSRFAMNNDAIIAYGGGRMSRFESETQPTFTHVDDDNTGLFLPGSDVIGFTSGGAEAMRISGSGFLGIGTTSVDTQLHVEGNATVVGMRLTNANAHRSLKVYF